MPSLHQSIKNMNDFPSVTIIILNWNASEYLTNCLTALQYVDYPNFIVQVVDNNSTDDSLELLSTQFPHIPVICNEENLGFSAGNNVALRQLETDIAVLLNPDVVVSPTWLRELVAPMQKDREIGVAGCKLYYPGGLVLQHAGGYVMGAQAWSNHYGLNERDNGQYDILRDVDYVIGAAMAIRKEVLTEVGLFDEGFFVYYEDTDFCFRVRKQGYRVIYVPESTAVHIESVTTDKKSLAFLTYINTGRWRFLLKQFTVEMLLNKSMVAEKAWLKKADFTHLTAVLRAYRAVLHQWSLITAANEDMDDEQRTQIKEELLSLREAALIQISSREPEEEALSPLMIMGRLQERPFTSDLPILGKFIVRFREMWNSVSAKWYVQPLIAQQDHLNRQIINRLHQLDNDFIDMDGEQFDIIYDIAKLTAQFMQTNDLLQSINDRLIELENHAIN